LPPSLAAIAGPLAGLHAPLTLIAVGLLLGRALQRGRLQRQVVWALLARHSPALILAAVATSFGNLHIALAASVVASLGAAKES